MNIDFQTERAVSKNLRTMPSRGLTLLAMSLAACGASSSLTEPGAVTPEPAAASVYVTVAPSSVTLPLAGHQTFAAAVTGSAELRVNWSIQEGAAGGSVSAGQYSAPGTPGVYHVVVASVADPTKTATATVTVTSGVPPVSSAKMGTNLNWCTDWDPEKMAADLVWCARPWALGSGNGDTPSNWAPIDAQGWPTVAVGTPFGAIFEAGPWPGVYKLSFKNRQGTTGDTVSQGYGNIALSNRQHNPTTNVTTYDVTVNSYDPGSFLWLRWAGSTGGVTDVHLMRPLKDGSGWHAIGTPLADHIIDRLRWFSAIRPMQTQGGESGKTSGRDTTWSDRTSPWGPQTRSRGTNGHFGGVAIENLVAMANQANKDLWITVPFLADDDYILKMAQAIRYGSDGYNPYTTDQANPVFAPLKPNLAVYVEHGNEIWNPGPGYWEGENVAADGSERAAGDPHRTGYRPSGSGTFGMAWRRVGYLAVRQSLIFRQVFGDASMMTRVRPILATQHSRYSTTDEPLYYIRDVWGQGYNSKVAYGQVNEYGIVARPVNYYLYGIATAPYIPSGDTPINVASTTTIIDSIIADMNDTRNGWPLTAMTWNANIAKSFDIKFLAYEGGNNLIPALLSGGATAANVQNARDASFDPVLGARMGAAIGADGLPAADQSNYVYGRMFKEWSDRGGGLFMHFTLGSSAGSGGMMGLCPPSAQSGSDTRLETGPKWDAVKAFNRAWGL